ncbi:MULTISPECIES: FAD-binding oxidoreductase [unclassified Mesorhizobium]|uniref:FAD-binding oxidoreductase n=1 Tax=unclassified Mesorhizobium TaxID=325217 RepID=UPI0033375486
MRDVTELSKSFHGVLYTPQSAGYNEARKIHNGMIDRRPSLIAQCKGMADIADAVRFARANDLEISVRGGGHNVGGRAVADDCLMIDLSLMKSVHVDAAKRTAIVGGGTLWKEFNREAQLYGLATTGGVVGTTGVGGLTLGGGIGFLMPKFGMALDNLLSVDLVMADGSVMTASAESNPDLFWAVRGGGGNFGVAGSFEFQVHPVGPEVLGGLVAFPFLEAREVLTQWRELTLEAPDELMLVAGLITAPDGSGSKLIAVVACHCGAPSDAEKVMARIRGFGTVAMDALGPIPYTQLNGMLDDGFPKGAFNYWKSSFIHTLTDEAIGAVISLYEGCPVPSNQVLLEHFHGAAARKPADETAYALRDTGYNVAIIGQWFDRTDESAATSWCRNTYSALEAYVGPRRYANYIGSDEDADAAAVAAYGANLPRLREIKRKYDPQNVFAHNVNIRPS